MDINKLNSSTTNNTLDKAEETSKGQQQSEVSSSKKATSQPTTDKVSLSSDYKAREDEQHFAKLELEKLEKASSKKLVDLNAKIKAYQEAKKSSPEAANNTELGQKINDPDVWGDIAQKILT